jgi:hypothetical protein
MSPAGDLQEGRGNSEVMPHGVWATSLLNEKRIDLYLTHELLQEGLVSPPQLPVLKASDHQCRGDLPSVKLGDSAGYF